MPNLGYSFGLGGQGKNSRHGTLRAPGLSGRTLPSHARYTHCLCTLEKIEIKWLWGSRRGWNASQRSVWRKRGRGERGRKEEAFNRIVAKRVSKLAKRRAHCYIKPARSFLLISPRRLYPPAAIPQQPPTNVRRRPPTSPRCLSGCPDKRKSSTRRCAQCVSTQRRWRSGNAPRRPQRKGCRRPGLSLLFCLYDDGLLIFLQRAAAVAQLHHSILQAAYTNAMLVVAQQQQPQQSQQSNYHPYASPRSEPSPRPSKRRRDSSSTNSPLPRLPPIMSISSITSPIPDSHMRSQRPVVVQNPNRGYSYPHSPPGSTSSTSDRSPTMMHDSETRRSLERLSAERSTS